MLPLSILIANVLRVLKFQVDVVQAVKQLILQPKTNNNTIPTDVARLEEHLSYAPRLHNVRKHRQVKF